MKKIKWQDVDRQNSGDCWNVALAYATHQEYKKVRKDLDCFIDENGSVYRDVSTAYLDKYDYKQHDMEGMKVKDVLQYFDTTNNHFVIAVKDHLFYVHKNTIYDNYPKDYRGEFYDKEVETVLYKPI